MPVQIAPAFFVYKRTAELLCSVIAVLPIRLEKLDDRRFVVLYVRADCMAKLLLNKLTVGDRLHHHRFRKHRVYIEEIFHRAFSYGK